MAVLRNDIQVTCWKRMFQPVPYVLRQKIFLLFPNPSPPPVAQKLWEPTFVSVRA